jgi:hypothetical protein
MTPQRQLDVRAATEPTLSPSEAPICPHCGGSGTLRHGDQLFRTCLDCLGQGRLASGMAHVSSQARVLPFQASTPDGLIPLPRPERISAVVSSAAAR